MKHVGAIAGRELNSLFVSPVAYAVMTLFAVLAGFFFLSSVLQFQEYVIRLQSFQAMEQLEELNLNDHVIAPFLHVMSVVLLFASALLIWNTIRTAMFARRREIEVMKLVGATNWFIRLPFMLEGLLQGIFGATLGSVALLLANDNWTNGVKDFPVNSGLKAFVVTDGYPVWVCFWMILLGAFVGAVGSATAASRFLDV